MYLVFLKVFFWVVVVEVVVGALAGLALWAMANAMSDRGS